MLHLIQTRKQKEGGNKKKNIVKDNNCSKVKYSRDTVDKSRENTKFQETSFFESLPCSIASNEINCLLVFALTRGLYKFFGGCISSIVAMHFTSILEGVAKYIR